MIGNAAVKVGDALVVLFVVIAGSVDVHAPVEVVVVVHRPPGWIVADETVTSVIVAPARDPWIAEKASSRHKSSLSALAGVMCDVGTVIVRITSGST